MAPSWNMPAGVGVLFGHGQTTEKSKVTSVLLLLLPTNANRALFLITDRKHVAEQATEHVNDLCRRE